MEHFWNDHHEKKIASIREHLNFIVNSKQKEWEVPFRYLKIYLLSHNNHCVSILRLYLFVLVCLLKGLIFNPKIAVSVFLKKLNLPNWWCSLYIVHGVLRYLLIGIPSFTQVFHNFFAHFMCKVGFCILVTRHFPWK